MLSKETNRKSNLLKIYLNLLSKFVWNYEIICVQKDIQWTKVLYDFI